MNDLPLHAWSWTHPVTATPITVGLINPTWRLDDVTGPVAILQRLNTAIFEPSVHEDTEAVTEHLARKGLPTPRLLRTAKGGLWHDDDQGGIWRAQTYLGDRTLCTVDDPQDAWEAGALLARFHAATTDLAWTFRHVRLGVHDTARHMATLAQSLIDHTDHRLWPEVAPLGRTLLDRWERLKAVLPDLPLRVVHGDPKLSNVRFQGPHALALVDLDTLARDTLGAELGDALRSWCGTAGEDDPNAVFDLEVFEAAMSGYASGAGAWGPTDAEWRAVVPSVQRIATELAARFAADALRESYFGWDPSRFATRGDANLARARGQANLALAVHAAEAPAQAILERVRPKG